MAIVLPIRKPSTLDAAASEPPRSVESPPITSSPDVVGLQDYIAKRTTSRYCGTQQRNNVIQIASTQFGFDSHEATHAVDFVLEHQGIANEFKLLLEMRSVLTGVSGDRKRLTDKDRADAIEMFIRRGLPAQVAEAAFLQFCRSSGVKLKTGMFSWNVP